jgi:hypothetical protein
MSFFRKKPKKGKKTKKTDREKLIEEAMANASLAREAIGDETLQKIAASMREKERKSAAIQAAKKKLLEVDKDVLADNIRFMLREE